MDPGPTKILKKEYGLHTREKFDVIFLNSVFPRVSTSDVGIFFQGQNQQGKQVPRKGIKSQNQQIKARQ